MTRWLLTTIEIEGFRGINNEGDPLALKFGADAVNSVSAPNGVGKSSIFEALTFALTGAIPKLDALPAAENGGDYYNNRFHSKGVGTIKLTIAPDDGGAAITIAVTRTADSKRVVTAPPGLDGEAILSALNRDFVLLDHKTFESFIDSKALQRGRAFSGVLGLARYSDFRQELQALANTRAFNSHFNTLSLEQTRHQLADRLAKLTASAQKAFVDLTGGSLANHPDHSAAIAIAHHALEQIEVLRAHCTGKSFGEVTIDDCVAAVSAAEGGKDRERLSALIQGQAQWEERIARDRTAEQGAKLKGLAHARDEALDATSGALLADALRAAKKVLEDETWNDPLLCPICTYSCERPVIDLVHAALEKYATVDAASAALASEWTYSAWGAMTVVEAAVIKEGEPRLFASAVSTLTEADVETLLNWKTTLLARAKTALDAVTAERAALEQKLPPSLVAVTAKAETARRLQDCWREAETIQQELARVRAVQARYDQLKIFLDTASDRFAKAEAAASQRRVKAVVPIVQNVFGAIMHEPLKPLLAKDGDGEGLILRLEEFWSLKDVSAQALLSESYRNAFAVSVYLAAASLYGGAPLFVVLDDVTSSFDAGHQYHLMEVIRTQFARPMKTNGLQVILFSHDTLLEKLFNKNVQQGGWTHQRLEGNARTAVLPQSHTANRLRDKTLAYLAAGQVEDAAPRVRQYLEFKLLEIIGRVRIPVPVDFALDDNKKQVQAAIDAIDAAVKLHQAAGSLILEPAQATAMATNIAAISGNFLAHYATGSTHAFSAASLQGVMRAIDDYATCFMFEDPPGSGKRYYKSLSAKT